ncbi:hypothetical protein ykris0001_1570 [Yersinia kristensenii ATCC 33638]|nr:hypothetical protein ykris0001_1570 [Yersinia kristensenii ATCC 33638]
MLISYSLSLFNFSISASAGIFIPINIIQIDMPGNCNK